MYIYIYIYTYSRGSSCALSGCRPGRISFGRVRKRAVCPLRTEKKTMKINPIITMITLGLSRHACVRDTQAGRKKQNNKQYKIIICLRVGRVSRGTSAKEGMRDGGRSAGSPRPSSRF